MFAISQDTATAVIAAAGMGLGFVVLAVVGWIFWRAARRDQQAEREQREGGDGTGRHAG